jgi:hypothetical protein
MAASVDTGMEKAEMKRLLVRSKKEPVNCAVAQPKDGPLALVLMDKIKQPKALVRDLEKQFADAKNPRWGTVFVDVDENPKLAVFAMKKALPGLGRRLVKTLKGTGFTKVEIRLEDGSLAEAVAEEEEEAQEAPALAPGAARTPDAAAPQAASGGAAPAQAAAPAPEGAAPQAAAGAAPKPDQDAAQLDALGRRLAELVKKAAQAGADAAHQKAMDAVVDAARKKLESCDLKAATKLIDGLQEALARPPAPAGGAAPARLAAAPKAWQGTIASIGDALDGLKQAVRKEFAGEPPALLAEVETHLGQLDKITTRFDDELEKLLQDAASATDAGARKVAAAKAKKVIADYIKFTQSEPLIAHTDKNPFGVKPDLRKLIARGLGEATQALS